MFAVAWWWMGAGCGHESLAELETEQQRLEKEVEVLRKNVEEMRALMQAMGKLPSGPAEQTTSRGDRDDLAGELAFSVERTGSPPRLPPPGEPSRRDNTACGYRFPIPWLEPISDQVLEMQGAGRASPVQLLLDGRELTPHAGPVAFERNCKFAFRHQPKYLFFSPDDDERIAGEWTMQLHPEIPMPRSDESVVYWVYPGTAARFSFEQGWNADSWGPFGVDLDARMLYVGTPDAPSERTGSPAVLSLLGTESVGDDERLSFSGAPTPPDGPWSFEISSPSDGPYVLIESLIVGNEHHALAIVEPSAGDR